MRERLIIKNQIIEMSNAEKRQLQEVEHCSDHIYSVRERVDDM